MREIKFRGKRVDNGEWVEGYLIQGCNISFMKMNHSYIVSNNQKAYQIIPETVGQFTGELDREKKDIYEGDLFKIGVEKEVFEVRFKHGCFMAYCNGIQYGLLGELLNSFIEVIGNIHDNPELLQR